MTETESMIPKRKWNLENLAAYEKELFNMYLDMDRNPDLCTIKQFISLSEDLREISVRMNHSYYRSYDDDLPIGYDEWKYLFKLRNEIGNYYFFKMVELMKNQTNILGE